MSSNLPTWPGASSVYSYLYKVLEQMGAYEWATFCEAAKKRGCKTPFGKFVPSEEMSYIIKMLGKGDEVALKSIQLAHKTSGAHYDPNYGGYR